MFQDFALFPHRTVAENIAFGLRMQQQSPAQIASRRAEMLALVNLSGYGERSVFALSGGERQRVALARSLAPNPRLLMLDEPLGSLDRTLREELMNDLRLILKGVGVTALYVTHDQQEALAVADRVVVMNAGQIEQIGTPQQIYHQPANPFVARFLGFENLLPAIVAADQWPTVVTPIGRFRLTADAQAGWEPGSYTLLIRPQAAMQIEPVTTAHPDTNQVQGVLALCSFRGSYYRISIQVGAGADSHHLSFEVPTWGAADPAQPMLSPGEFVQITLNPALLSLL
jgi:ABC-type Fe3+/spermidine/putrescine transport system ATPase subunit